MPVEGEKFDHAKAMLSQSIGLLNGAFAATLGTPIEKPGPYPGDHLQSIGSRILDVMTTFDRLQLAMGLSPGQEPKFARFLQEHGDHSTRATDVEPSPN